MKFKDIPKTELDSGSYSKETLDALMRVEKVEYHQYVKRSAVRYIPLLIGSYLCICAMLAGYAVANDESAYVFNVIYAALLYLWIPLSMFLPYSWWRSRPSKKKLVEEIGWYKELLQSSSKLKA